jgi:D-alanyl-D-alanine carboxypeptidase
MSSSTRETRSIWQACRIAAAALAVMAAAPISPLLPPSEQGALEESLRQLMAANALPSVLVDVVRPGAAPYSFVVGPAADGSAAQRTAGQPFRIASVTKTFTATAILLLADRGKLAVADPISRWFPDFPNAGLITVDDLLRMRSGIAAPSDEALGQAVFDDPLAPALSLRERMDAAAKLRARFTPPNQSGQPGQYVNLNYDILGGIIEKVSGQSAAAFIKANIIDRIGLQQTAFPTDDRLVGGLHGYGRDQAGVLRDKTRLNSALAGTAGAMISDAGDLRRWARALCTGELLAPATQAARMQGQPLAGTNALYGQGLITGPGACGHSGSIPGFSTDLYYFSEFDATVVTSVNRLDRDDALQTPPVLAAVYGALQAELQPKGYCQRIGTSTALHPISDALRQDVQTAFAVPEQATQGVWRCEGGRVIACIVGANLPCGLISVGMSIPAADEWCRSHPGDDLPAYVVGHGTAWHWRCNGIRAEHGAPAWTLDSAGFARELWHAL